MPGQEFFQQLRGQLTVTRRIVIFVRHQRDIATADDEDNALCMSDSRSLEKFHGHVRGPTLASFIDTDSPEWRSKHSDGTLATVASIVYHGRSWLYTSVMVAMVTYTSYVYYYSGTPLKRPLLGPKILSITNGCP